METFKSHLAKALLLFGLLLMVGCDSTSNLEAPEILTAEEAEIIATSANARAVFELYSESLDLLNAAIARGIPAERMGQLYLEGSPEFSQLVFGSDEVALQWEERRANALNALVKEFPVLKRLAEDGATACPVTDRESIKRLFASLESRQSSVGNVEPANLSASMAEGPVCGSYWQQAKLLACSAAASFCGPTALLCGWGCWCMLCKDNSAIADTFC
jgi:hypothetical protein